MRIMRIDAKVAEIVFKEESYRLIGLILNCMEHGALRMEQCKCEYMFINQYI